MKRDSSLRLFVTQSVLLLFLLLPAAARVHAQEPTQAGPPAPKAERFYDSRNNRGPRFDLSEEPGVFRYLEQERPKRPHDKVVYVGYGKLGEVARYLKAVREWLRDRGGVPDDLIVTFDGGREKEFRYEVWLVPPGAALPEVAGPPPEDENAPLEFAVYHYASVCEECGNWTTLDALVEELKKRPQRRAYLEFYPCGRGARFSFADARREALRRAAKDKLSLVKAGVPPAQIKAVVGDKDMWTHAELWLVPPGAEPPTTKAKTLK